MEKRILKKSRMRRKRALRVRKKLRNCPGRPRLSIKKSNANLFAQIIDDAKGHTLCSISTLGKDIRKTELAKKCKDSARKLGELLAEKAKQANITKVVLDRGCSKYHGVITALAEGLRASGIEL